MGFDGTERKVWRPDSRGWSGWVGRDFGGICDGRLEMWDVWWSRGRVGLLLVLWVGIGMGTCGCGWGAWTSL